MQFDAYRYVCRYLYSDQRDSGWLVCLQLRAVALQILFGVSPSCEKANLKQPSTFPSLSSNLSSPMNTSSCRSQAAGFVRDMNIGLVWVLDSSVALAVLRVASTCTSDGVSD